MKFSNRSWKATHLVPMVKKNYQKQTRKQVIDICQSGQSFNVISKVKHSVSHYPQNKENVEQWLAFFMIDNLQNLF